MLASALGACSTRAQGTTVDVWVDLTEPLPGAGADRDQARQQRERVLRQQDEVSAQLQRLGGTELARVRQTGNAIAVRIDATALEQVRMLPGVRGVRPVVKLHPPRTGQ